LLIVDEAMFSESYVPDNLPGREKQKNEILRCLAPATRQRRPAHLWLYGKPGTGKTTTVLAALKDLKAKSGVQTLLVNCWEKGTFFEVVDEMIGQLTILRAEENRASLKFQKLRRHLNGRPVVIVLDEFDQIRPAERSTAIYNLLLLEKAGLVCISNCENSLFELEDRVRSRLNPYLIPFPAYSSEALAEILRQRAAMGLAPDAWSERALAQIAESAGGDARIAVQTLRHAGEMGEEDNGRKISVRIMSTQRTRVSTAKRASVLNTLTEDHRILYSIVKKKGQVLSGDLREGYLRRCKQLGRKPVASRTFSNYSNKLAQAGAVHLEQARVKGNARVFKYVE